MVIKSSQKGSDKLAFAIPVNFYNHAATTKIFFYLCQIIMYTRGKLLH